jgi:hypothetical protein
LISFICAGIEFKYGTWNLVDIQEAGEGKAGRTGANDCNLRADMMFEYEDVEW